MKLEKKIYQNGSLVNVFTSDDEEAKTELVNLLLNKIDGMYKVKIQKDPCKNTIKSVLYFTHRSWDGKVISKYKYEYAFTDVPKSIDLH